jgi:glycyl-tRNA synthetase beta chain
MSKDLLFEIGTEELPADACEQAIVQLEARAAEALASIGLPHGGITVMATPRRLVLSVKSLAESGEASIIEVKGPSKAAAIGADGKPTPAAFGFAKSQGADPKDFTYRAEGKGEYVYLQKKIPAPKAGEVLPGLLKDLVLKLEFDKSMRWAGYQTRFSRPIRWLLALYGDKKIPVEIEMLTSGGVTFGPRITGSQKIKVADAADYFTQIKKTGIMVDHKKRRELIIKEIEAAAAKAGGRAAINQKVLDEVLFLVEAPNAVAGTFDKDFLKLPRPVIVTAMESHQRYFPVEDAKGNLQAAFIVIHNGPAKSADLIRKGHERVLRARLADALFFYEEDAKVPLEDRVADLKGIVFQEKLGTVYEKAERVKALALEAAEQLDYTDDETAEAGRAAMLAKADLSTNMVREFPDLQGIVGEEYARRDGHPEAVARAISEHYLPKNFGDVLPLTKTGVAVSLADKIDTIAGCFGIGLIPTGSEDPYALRRQGQAIVSIILEEKLPLELEPLVAKAVFAYEKAGVKLRPAGDILADIEKFIGARLKYHFMSEGFRYDVADAVLETEINDLVALEATARSINELLGSKVLDNVLTGFERCYNLSKAAKDNFVDATLFVHASENGLLETVEMTEAAYEKYLEDGNVLKYMKSLAAMKPAVDRYFDDVLVMDKDDKIKNNRMALLKKCARLYLAVADFSRIVREGD